MPCPEFYYFIRPGLDAVVKAPDCHWRDVGEEAAKALGLSAADREELVASGQKTKFEDRVHWALTYLRAAKLIERSGRGRNRPTPAGLDYLKRAPNPIKPSDLQEFPDFRKFSSPTVKGSIQKAPAESPSVPDVTPIEAIEQAHASIRAELAENLLELLKKVSPARFEKIIVDLMLGLGYGGPRDDAGEALGKTGDGGIDGIIRQDRLGLENIYLQAKRWSDNTVGTAEINGFIGALTTRGANKGVLITTSTFSEAAKKIASSVPHLKLSLIDGRELARLMIDNDLGVALEARYDVKRIDSDFFIEE